MRRGCSTRLIGRRWAAVSGHWVSQKFFANIVRKLLKIWASSGASCRTRSMIWRGALTRASLSWRVSQLPSHSLSVKAPFSIMNCESRLFACRPGGDSTS
jgi:hypothetical protein